MRALRLAYIIFLTYGVGINCYLSIKVGGRGEGFMVGLSNIFDPGLRGCSNTSPQHLSELESDIVVGEGTITPYGGSLTGQTSVYSAADRFGRVCDGENLVFDQPSRTDLNGFFRTFVLIRRVGLWPAHRTHCNSLDDYRVCANGRTGHVFIFRAP